jgi:SOS-response transcriptional repressor LexA
VQNDLKALRVAVGWTQDEAAHEFGVSARTWGSWERGQTQAPSAVVELLEIKARGIATDAVCVAVEGIVRAGTAELQLRAERGRVAVVPARKGEPLFAVEVRGDSMAPEIKGGDVLVCRLVEDDDAPTKSIIVADIGESEYVVKRLVFRQARRMLESINDGHAIITKAFRIHAIVVEIRRTLERR